MTAANPAPGFENHPNHDIRIEPFEGNLKIIMGEHVIAEGSRALVLRESKYQPAFYLLKSILPHDMLERSDHKTYCPFKGEASYYHLVHEGRRHENAVWSYERPYDEVSAIKDHIAIYPNIAKVSIDHK